MFMIYIYLCDLVYYIHRYTFDPLCAPRPVLVLVVAWHATVHTTTYIRFWDVANQELCFFRRLKFSSWLFLQRLSFSPTLARVCRQVSHPDGSAVHTNEDDDLTIISPECCCSSPSGEVRWCTNTSKGWASLKMDCSESETTKVRNKKTKKNPTIPKATVGSRLRISSSTYF